MYREANRRGLRPWYVIEFVEQRLHLFRHAAQVVLVRSDRSNEATRRASNRFLLSPSFIHLGCRYALRAMLSFLRLSRGLSCKPIT